MQQNATVGYIKRQAAFHPCGPGFVALAELIDETYPNGSEKSTALRKLLESIDAVVRCEVDRSGGGLFRTARISEHLFDPISGKPAVSGSPYTMPAEPKRDGE